MSYSTEDIYHMPRPLALRQPGGTTIVFSDGASDAVKLPKTADMEWLPSTDSPAHKAHPWKHMAGAE